MLRPLCTHGQRPCRLWRGQHCERPRWPYMRLPCLSMCSFVYQSSIYPVVKCFSPHLISDYSCLHLWFSIKLSSCTYLSFLISLLCCGYDPEECQAGWIADALASFKHWIFFCQPSSSVFPSLHLVSLEEVHSFH